MQYFRDRTHAGQLLAQALHKYKSEADLLILGLPRGGVPVAYEVALALAAPLDLLIVRKLGVPGHEELAMGAISSGGGQVLNMQVVDALGISRQAIETVASREWHEIEQREQLYRRGRAALQLEHKNLILVDDGLATGSTMRAGIKVLRHLNPLSIVVGVPVAPASTCAELSDLVDEMICLFQAENFFSVGEWYEDFSQTAEDEVCALLKAADKRNLSHHHLSKPRWEAGAEL